MTGRYIAFEGIEGAGKSTVARMVGDRLIAAGHEVLEVREPGGTPTGEEIRRVLLSPDGSMGPWTEALLFAAARAQLATEVIGPALEAGTWVVSDRSVYSSLAYQGGARRLGIDTVRTVNRAGLGDVWPQRVVLLRIDAATGRRRQHVEDRIGSEGEGFLGAAADAFDALAAAEPRRFVVVDASAGLDEVVDRAWAALREIVRVFTDVIGHDAVRRLLAGETAAPAQAYLFTGPESVGKATVARRFAAALLCGDDAGCVRRVLHGSHTDLVVIEPEGRAAITVDQARRVVSLASLAPMEGGRKVFLFEEGGAMNDEAANALLKTIEEPTATTTFIIVTESEDDLPATIASRRRTVVFGRVPDHEIAVALQERGVDAEQAVRAARISGGRPGLALALATRPEVAEYRRVWLTLPLHLPDHPGDAYRLADDVMSAAEPLLAAIRQRHEEQREAAERDGAALKALKERQERELKRATTALFVTGLEILAGFYRDAAAAQFGVAPRNADVPVTAFTMVRPSRALAAAERVLDTVDSLRANQRPHLAFAALFADLGGDG